MKLTLECYDCLRRLTCQAANLATDNTSLKQKAMEEATKVLDNEFSYNEISIVIATKIHKVIKGITRNPDPYWMMKEKEIAIARELYPELSLRAKRSNLYKNDFSNYLKLAAAGNAIDFFRESSTIREDMKKPVNFVIDDSECFEAKLKGASKVLYLADNVGEIYFDLPLVK